MTLEQKIRNAIPELMDNSDNDTLDFKPIQLNHVLEYVKSLNRPVDIIILYFLRNWNLKSNLLSDQSPELKNFINELA